MRDIQGGGGEFLLHNHVLFFFPPEVSTLEFWGKHDFSWLLVLRLFCDMSPPHPQMLFVFCSPEMFPSVALRFLHPGKVSQFFANQGS